MDFTDFYDSFLVKCMFMNVYNSHRFFMFCLMNCIDLYKFWIHRFVWLYMNFMDFNAFSWISMISIHVFMNSMCFLWFPCDFRFLLLVYDFRYFHDSIGVLYEFHSFLYFVMKVLESRNVLWMWYFSWISLNFNDVDDFLWICLF